MHRFLFAVLVSISLVTSQPPSENPDQISIGLALSAGGALGLAHIGVLKVFERECIPVSCISANSMGSIIGGLYAAGYSATQIESIVVSLDWHKILKLGISFGTQYLPDRQRNHRYVFRLEHKNFYPSLPSELISLQKVEFLLIKLLAQIEYNTYYNFDSLTIPFRAIAVDLVSGRKVILRQGSLAQAIRGSIAIPGVFAPKIIKEKTLVDGGVLQYLPVDPLKEMNPDITIAILTAKYDKETGISLIDVISRTTSMVGLEDVRQQKQLADIVIEPDVESFDALDYSKAEDLIAAGEAAAEAALPEIHKKIGDRAPISGRKKIDNRKPPIVGSLQIEGLQVTQEKTIKNNIQTKQDLPLNFDRLYNDLVEIYNTGLFHQVSFRLENTDNDTVDVIIEVRERDYGFYFLGIRYDNENNATIGVEIGQDNIKGTGMSIRGAINLGDPNEFRLGIVDINPPFMPIGYRIDCFWSSIDRSFYEGNEWQADYGIDYRGGLAEIGQTIGYDAFYNIGIEAYQALYRFPSLPRFDTLLAKEWIVGPSLQWEFNTLDDLYLPSKGFEYRLNMLYSNATIGGTKEFLRVDFSAEHFIPLGSWMLLHPSIILGTCFGELSWSNYFYTGGPDFIGFNTEEFTTTDRIIGRLDLGFRMFNLFNQKDYPVYLQLISNIATFESIDRILETGLKLDNTHLGVGVGIKTNTPIGPFQISVGCADFHKQPAEDNFRTALFVQIGRDFRYTK